MESFHFWCLCQAEHHPYPSEAEINSLHDDSSASNSLSVSIVQREREKPKRLDSVNANSTTTKNPPKKLVTVKAIQRHPCTSHSSQQHLQRASVVVTPREAGRGFSLREAPAGGAKASSTMTEAGVEELLENSVPGEPARAKNYRQGRRSVGKWQHFANIHK